ncbi:MAG: Bifunctional folylpolyglutamate synthase/ dihydrofolate synthase [Verrucomicrobiales bacterium]|nr:Bifunctional folylpolyglutamate synthase/ dihydrofolate synthase [Verrucomicrobiales bacterium]
MTYSEAIQYLYSFRRFGAKLGLENTFALAGLFGNPQNKLRFIHVAGTNGKGSTCAMLESIYRAAGLRVGLFTSPHLVSFRERIQVDREMIRENEVAVLVDDLKFRIKDLKSHPTFFEVVTVMALRYFAAKKCDIVIWETGLGGRLDSTNIVTPIASVITNVQLDHQQWLGNTIPEIAREKAGIIKKGVPCFTAAVDDMALQTIAQVAARHDSAFWTVSQGEADEMREFEIPLIGDHQRLNAALAVAVVRLLGNQISVPEQAITEGLKHTQWSGRFQIVRRGEQTIVLDGAHNPAGAESLAAALKQNFSGAELTLVLGAMQDKDVRAICGTLAPLAKKIVVTRVGSERAAAPAELFECCQTANVAANVTAVGSLAEALNVTQHDKVIVVTGSLHFIGEALELLRLTDSPSERELNEYMPAPKK